MSPSPPPPRRNIDALLDLILTEIQAKVGRVATMPLREVDALVRDIEGDVERLRGEVDLALLHEVCSGANAGANAATSKE